MRDTFVNQLEYLNSSIIQMGKMVENALDRTTQSMLKKDREMAAQNIEMDKDIDHKMKDIESLCLKLLMRQQPVARDLRLISAALKMVSDLERIGDQAADISEIFLTLPEKCDVRQVPEIPAMCDAVRKMLHNSVQSFVYLNLDLANFVCDSDDAVDAFFTQTKKNLIEAIRSPGTMQDYATDMDLFMIAKYLERIGDHAVNVAKWVIFFDTGMRNGTNYMIAEEPLSQIDKIEDK